VSRVKLAHRQTFDPCVTLCDNQTRCQAMMRLRSRRFLQEVPISLNDNEVMLILITYGIL